MSRSLSVSHTLTVHDTESPRVPVGRNGGLTESRQQKQNRITAFVLTYNLIHAKNYVLTYVYKELVKTYIPYGRKFWRGIYFGGLAVLRAIRQYFIRQKLHSVMSSLLRNHSLCTSFSYIRQSNRRHGVYH